jgi:ubiquitin carboxyl-terminal hydrolase 14
MSTINVVCKHAGKAYPVTVDLDAPGLALKQQIHQLTGVEPAKVKVVVKGGMLKVSTSGSCQSASKLTLEHPTGRC